jgi:hypothetical protein
MESVFPIVLRRVSAPPMRRRCFSALLVRHRRLLAWHPLHTEY